MVNAAAPGNPNNAYILCKFQVDKWKYLPCVQTLSKIVTRYISFVVTTLSSIDGSAAATYGRLCFPLHRMCVLRNIYIYICVRWMVQLPYVLRPEHVCVSQHDTQHGEGDLGMFCLSCRYG